VVDLDGLPVPRITYSNHAWELAAHEFYGPKILELIGKSGAKWGAIGPLDAISTSAHVMGTLRFGKDPTTSVCDPTGRFHDVGNLWGGDGCLFPTSSGYNPTLTIVALAIYVAGNLASPGSPERALPPP
jgi:choline dehydrogenase-like flavoprotein